MIYERYVYSVYRSHLNCHQIVKTYFRMSFRYRYISNCGVHILLHNTNMYTNNVCKVLLFSILFYKTLYGKRILSFKSIVFQHHQKLH